MATTTTTVTVSLYSGETVSVAPRWRGIALMVHPPIDRASGAVSVKRARWIIASHATGLRAGTYHGPLRDAVKLARLWDRAFADALAVAPSLAQWPQRQAWSRQCDRLELPTGPVPADHPDYLAPDRPAFISRERVAAADGDGAEQWPATATVTRGSKPGKVRYARRLPDGRERLRDPETGRAVRMNGDCAAFRGPDPLTPVFRLWFDGKWLDVPSIAECMEWSLDGVAEAPDGSRVEPDAPDSWLTLLGII